MEGAEIFMIRIIQTRLIHWKNNLFNVIFWLLFPMLATILTFQLFIVVQDDTKIPVGVVIEEVTPLATELIENMKQSSLLRVYNLDEREALYLLKKHELDSVFIIHSNYDDNIKKDNRQQLVTSYRSQSSLTYTPVKETIISYVQQQSSRSKAAHIIEDLIKATNLDGKWTWDNIIELSQDIQSEANLVKSTFTFSDKPSVQEEKTTIVKPWHLWAIFSVLATLLLFDWVIKETQSNVAVRYSLMRISFKSYLMCHLLIYIGALVIVDLITLLIFFKFFDETSIQFLGTLVTFRLMISLGAFLFALCFKRSFMFYSCSFGLTLLLAVTSGAIIPMEILNMKWPLFTLLHPLRPFLTNNYSMTWLIVFTVLVIIWYIREEKSYA